MTRVGVLVRPPTRRATIETINLLEQMNFDSIFIDLPREIECFVLDYLKHKNLGSFLRQISEAMPPEEFPTSIVRGYELLLEAISRLAVDKTVYCYGSVLKKKYETEIAYLSAQLTLHDTIAGRISIDKWISLIFSSTSNFTEWIKEEAEYIASVAEGCREAICISGPDGSILKKHLSNYFTSWIKYTGQPFHLPPINVLSRIISIRKIDRDEVIKLVKEHIKFIREFIIPYGLEDGLELWSRKKLYWLIHPSH